MSDCSLRSPSRWMRSMLALLGTATLIALPRLAVAQTASAEELAAFGAAERPLDRTGSAVLGAKRFGPSPERSVAELLDTAKPERARRIFDGRTLTGWRGDTRRWVAADGVISGSSDEQLANNTFLIFDQEVGDFALTLDFMLSPPMANNSGVQYRSVEFGSVPFVLKGMQADIHFAVDPERGVNYAGMIWDEKGDRGVIALKGQRVWVSPEGARVKVGRLNDSAYLMSMLRPNDWNRMRIVACGQRLVHEVNGEIFVDVIDDHPAARQRGRVALQLHAVQPTRAPHAVMFRNILLNDRLPATLCERYRIRPASVAGVVPVQAARR